MATYILDNHDRVAVARRPVTVTVAGGREGGVRLTAHRGDAVDDGGAILPRPGVMVLPRVGGRTVIRVEPGHGHHVFAEGTLLNLTLRTDRTRDAEEDVVIVRNVEVSGLALRDLVAIDVEDDRRLSVSALNAVVDTPIGKLPAAARAAARTRLGVDRTANPNLQ